MADDSNVLDQLVARVEDNTLRTRLAYEIELLRGSRHFGLVFDRHLPESVRLPDHPVRKGIRVALRDETSARTWIVDRFADRARETAVLSGDGGVRPVAELVVVREFDEPIYPGLRTVERIENGPSDAPWHVVINGENFHALQALRSTHRNKIDLIYVDPPYNTGNDGWIYNDRYVDQNDRAKSSKWLSFMERRLLIARDLLKPTGVIIAAIGDDEHHRLRMLLDQLFGPANFIMNAVWQGGGSALARHHAGGVDYMLVYGRNAEQVGRFMDPKPFVPEMLRLVDAALSSGKSPEEAQESLREFIKTNQRHMPEGVTRFNNVDQNGMIFETSDLTNRLPRPNLRYVVTDPNSGKQYEPPENGWTVQKSLMDEWIAAGLVAFGRRPRKKKSLVDYAQNMPVPAFTHSRNAANTHLQGLLTEKRFPFPKDHEVLARWFRMAAPRDAVILDFFGGSGSTTEAVMQLNAADGGTRQSILVTNNEVGASEAKKLRTLGLRPGDADWEARGVFEFVCRPRISTVATGKRENGSKYSDGLAVNVEMLDLTYLDPGMVRRGHEFEAVAPLMWLEAGARGQRVDRIPDDGWALTKAYGVLFDIDALAIFAGAVTDASVTGASPQVVFVITDSDAEYQRAVERLPVGVDTVQLYEDYLSNYTINIAGGPR
ncbi:site-specific DNA-methyltransferase [Rhodococcoides corynebacterioides]|uniref:Site-specific DNA-methyltransferase n=1 Tax=Rhodococcoides corynebacterioides TaxID=53972 RepID=A0ABS7P3G6_9NOCA|nr:site-specific DNA-methyltransferase [Rhodococcus corynebacterioides]MBY6366959.1 site-specific DNA-methyltransferase [Rhodococcus corynebacterioides]MBY6407761.1 site-specific DNA-methyltransferase [Rhodococcus corynebacterioides]